MTATGEAASEVAVEPADGAGGSDIAAMEWAELASAVRDCTRCPLHETRTQGVFGVGNRRADLLIIGEAPGAEEDRRGEPFVGRAGGLLDVMLNAIGLDRGTVYITNILKSRPPDNRDPKAEEVAACEPFLRRQIELIEPRAILAVGRVAAQNLLGTSQALGKLRGRWHQYGPQATPVRVSYHPAYLLRRPQDKRKAWQDLKLVRAAIGQ
jgi:DNA polymerase